MRRRSFGSWGACLVLCCVSAGCRTHEGDRVEVGEQEACYACHQPEYEATTAPPHVDLFETTCEQCHSTDAWVPATALQHDWFLLQNRHAEVPCVDCHTVGFRSGDTPMACAGCHQADYDAATMPPHAGYPTDCASCHDDAGWSPSTFAHPFALDGAHALITCATCHTGEPPMWTGLPTECVGCHRADYDMSPFAGHDTFPTTCASCHSTAAWVPAIEGGHPEPEFPIMDGAHSGYECTDCHDPLLGASAMGMNTDCVGCHEGQHARAQVDEQHREVADYPPGSASVNFCLECHPDGNN